MMVRELGFEMKAQPSNRMKTEEELAQEEQERLEGLEVFGVGGQGGGGSTALGSGYDHKDPFHFVLFDGLKVCCVLPVESF